MSDLQLTQDIKLHDVYGVNLKGDLVFKKDRAETSWRAKTSEINVGPSLSGDEGGMLEESHEGYLNGCDPEAMFGQNLGNTIVPHKCFISDALRMSYFWELLAAPK